MPATALTVRLMMRSISYRRYRSMAIPDEIGRNANAMASGISVSDRIPNMSSSSTPPNMICNQRVDADHREQPPDAVAGSPGEDGRAHRRKRQEGDTQGDLVAEFLPVSGLELQPQARTEARDRRDHNGHPHHHPPPAPPIRNRPHVCSRIHRLTALLGRMLGSRRQDHARQVTPRLEESTGDGGACG